MSRLYSAPCSLQPAHGALDVMYLCGISRGIDESVVSRGDSDTALRQCREPLFGAIGLVADLPPAAVEINHDRHASIPAGR